MSTADKVITYLCMTDPAEIRPGRTAPASVTLAGTNDELTLRPIYEALADSWRWPHWDSWKIGFSRPGRHFYLILVDQRPAGLAKFIDHGSGDIQIDNFGLVDDFTGKGFGGAALTQVIEAAWKLASRHESGRVWLHTCNWDHPHALPNYKARGFAVVLEEPEAASENRRFVLPAGSCVAEDLPEGVPGASVSQARSMTTNPESP